MKINALILTIFIFAISSCAGISPDKMKQEIQGYSLPIKAQKGRALVYVVRPSILGKLIKFNVFLDDKEELSEIGYNQGNQYFYFFVAPGKHKILSKAENWAEIDIEAKSEDQIFIKQNASIGFIMARNNLELITEVEGIYLVKNTPAQGVIKKLN